MAILGPDGRPLRSEDLGVGILLPAGVEDEDALSMAAHLATALLALERAGDVATIRVTPRLLWDLIGTVQLALRHPTYPESVREGIETFVREGLINDLCALTEQRCGPGLASAVAAVAMMGFDEDYDVEPPTADVGERRTAGVCTVCGCTDDRACEGGCSWVSLDRTLCTRCARLSTTNGVAKGAP